MNEPRVLWLRLRERVSAKGTAYLTGLSGEARVVGFKSKEPNKFGNPVWDLFLQPPRQDRPSRDAERGRATGQALEEVARGWSQAERDRYTQELAAKFKPDEEIPF
jgi:hypothetical protein